MSDQIRCNCTAASDCPLGRMGTEERCTVVELQDAVRRLKKMHATAPTDSLTKREFFAGLAMQGIVSRESRLAGPQMVAQSAVQFGDALLTQLEQ